MNGCEINAVIIIFVAVTQMFKIKDMKRFHCFSLMLICAVLLSVAEGMAGERKTLMDAGWRFFKGEGESAFSEPSYDDSQWRVVDLPHDWSIEGVPSADEPSGNDGGYRPTGKGWYRKTFEISSEDLTKLHSLYFEGVYMDAEVFVNGHSLGIHHYGYSSFIHDITTWLHAGRNVIAVSVDNSKQKNCRWYSGSGIYRHVWMISTEDVHFKHWGTFITTPEADETSAVVKVSAEIVNDSGDDRKVEAEVIMYDPQGREVGRKSGVLALPEGDASAWVESVEVGDPSLWSPDTPSVYTAKLNIYENGTLKDSIEETFGIRTVSYSAEDGLVLNGRKIELNGGCIHHDNGILGAAAFDRAEVRKVRLMKDAGFNAVRTSHNHPSEAFLHACDTIGLLVIDETFDGWRAAKLPYDYSTLIDDHWQEDVAALVLRDRNHPSIFCWSVGNEVIERKELQVVTTARKLAGLCRQLDPTRPVTSALCAWDSDWEIYDPLAEAFEIVGYNYMIFKHAGDHERDPQRIIVQTESYPRDAYSNWAYCHDHPYIIGDFVWTSVDYLGESAIGRWYYEGDSPGEHYHRPQFPWNAAYCGDIDLTGERKPISYYRDLLWNEDRPVYLCVKEPDGYRGKIRETQWSVWPAFESWTWPGHEGKDIDVVVYSRAPKVRLYLNGRLVGEKYTTRDQEFKAVFTVPYEPGELRAEAIDNYGNALVEMNEGGHTVLKTAGKPYALRLKADRTLLDADGQDLSFVTIEVVDRNGVVCPDAADEVRVAVEGAAGLAALGNADIKELGTTVDEVHNVWKGHALAVVRSSHDSGKVKIKIISPGLRSAGLTLKVR